MTTYSGNLNQQNPVSSTLAKLSSRALSVKNQPGRAPARAAGPPLSHLRNFLVFFCLLSVMMGLCGCTSLSEYIHNGYKVGPNYATPPGPVSQDWIDASDQRVRNQADDLSKWWSVFNDPTLDRLICFAYQQNLTLREAGLRVLQARAQLGIAVGNFFPQTLQAKGDYTRNAVSRETAFAKSAGARQQFYSQWDLGFNLVWELDFWGRFRRAIESSSASLDASVADYDDVLVTLLGDVASNYVQMRTAEQRIKYARMNVAIQSETLKIAAAQFKGGAVTELDVDQAQALLKQTEATIPELEINLRQINNQLCILLGIPPEELRKKIGEGPVPHVDPEVALGVGIPADLLRRRPDIRKAERQAAAQSAQIGVAEADFYPHITITGEFTYSAERFKNLFRLSALNGTFGPSFQWNVLNAGRILSNVRLQDARFQELVAAYQNKVLEAQKEVENGLITYLKAQERTQLQVESVLFAEKAVKVVMAQYLGGLENFTRVTQLQQILVQEQDTLAQAQGEISLGLIQVYKSLGGGWEMRCAICNPDTEQIQSGAEFLENPARFLDPRTIQKTLPTLPDPKEMPASPESAPAPRELKQPPLSTPVPSSSSTAPDRNIEPRRPFMPAFLRQTAKDARTLLNEISGN